MRVGRGYSDSPPQRTRRTQSLVFDDTANAVAKMRNVEVDQQANLVATQLQVGQNLRKVQRKQFFNCFDFDDDAVFDNKVDAIGGIQLNTLIDDRKPNLMRENYSILSELIAETRIVRALEAASSNSGMDFEGGAKNPFRDRSVQRQLFVSVSSVSSAVASLVSDFRMQSPVL